MVTIKVVVKAPKRLAGERTFNSFEETYRWLRENFKRPRLLVFDIIVQLAEKGEFPWVLRHGLAIYAYSDVKIGYKAKKLSYELALSKVKRRRTLEIPRSTWLKLTDEDCLKYAKTIDELARKNVSI